MKVRACFRCSSTNDLAANGYCHGCFNAYMRERRRDPSIRAKEQNSNRMWHARNIATENARSRAYYYSHRRTVLSRRNLLHAQVKAAVMAHYGAVCTCCGETHPEFLSIDHKNGGGTQHRKVVGGGAKFYAWLKRNNYPTGYQVLCFNCNMALGFSGYCPHHPSRKRQRERQGRRRS